MTTPVTVQAADHLTWERTTDARLDYLDCAAPKPIANYMPEWFKQLKGNVRDYLPEGFADDHTIRHCLGFRGIAQLGYTMPLPEDLTGYDTAFSRGRLHPEMLHGTVWANKPGGPWRDPLCPGGYDLSPYEYRIRLLAWPWRARMSRGWRLIILPYMLDWSKDWHSFAGAVEPNYEISVDGCGIGDALRWGSPIYPEYNYYNIETVIAYKRDTIIPKGTITFTALPVFDPELYDKQKDMK